MKVLKIMRKNYQHLILVEEDGTPVDPQPTYEDDERNREIRRYAREAGERLKAVLSDPVVNNAASSLIRTLTAPSIS